MLNIKDEYLAQERYADLRRQAEAHNAAARLRKQERSGDEAAPAHSTLRHWMHKFLHGEAGAHNQTAVNLR